MNKRIASLLLCFAMVFAMLATAVPVFAWSTETATVELSVVADKTEASPGDTITYTVNIGPIKRLQGINFTLIIPDGLIYGVGKEVDGIKALLGADKAEYTDPTKTFVAVGGGVYTSDSTTPLMTFTCTVGTGTVGKTLEIEVMDDWDIVDNDCETYQNVNINTAPSKVKVVSAPKPATGISLNKTATTIYTGSSETLTATVTPSDSTDAVEWSSDKPAVAKVDSTGKVTAIAPGTATITAKAGSKSASCVVTVENAPCAHNFNKETKSADALKTAGTCKDNAVYYYSCSICGAVEHNDAHTFKGDKDAANHVGGTYLKNKKDATCKDEGYTGDTYCSGCNVKLSEGSTVAKTAHTPGTDWKTDGTHHWHICTVAGCGAVVDSTKAAHSSTGANAANCQHKATCDVCGIEYGTIAAHEPATAWTNDATGHWHACKTSGCTEKLSFAAHTPDHTGHATEEYAIKCTVCEYVIEAQLAHTHVYDRTVATDAYKASDATCIAKAKYYKSCKCGEKGTETFEYGSFAAHTPGTEWKTDGTHHWHTCTVAGCGAVIDSTKAAHSSTGANAANCQHKAKCDVCGIQYGAIAAHEPATGWTNDATGHWHACKTSGCTEKLSFSAHTPNHTGHATEDYAIECTVCGYVIEAQKGHTHHIVSVVAKAPTCTEKGNKAYYICSICNTVFEDAAAKNAITADKVVIPALGHEYTEKIADDAHKKDTAADCRSHDTYWYGCSRCGQNAKNDPAAKDKWYEGTRAGAHSYDKSAWGYKGADGHAHKCRYDDTHDTPVAHTPGAAATETTPQICTECGYVIVPALGHVHSMTKVDATSATCTENGNIEYYKCDGCGKLFADAAGNTEITADKVVIAATGHDYEWKIDREATETANGSKHEECKNCGDMKDSVEIPATGTPEKSEPESPQTGDIDNMIIWIALLIISGGAVAGTVLYSRKKRAE